LFVQFTVDSSVERVAGSVPALGANAWLADAVAAAAEANVDEQDSEPKPDIAEDVHAATDGKACVQAVTLTLAPQTDDGIVNY
jgi:hypothetical protein